MAVNASELILISVGLTVLWTALLVVLGAWLYRWGKKRRATGEVRWDGSPHYQPVIFDRIMCRLTGGHECKMDTHPRGSCIHCGYWPHVKDVTPPTWVRDVLEQHGEGSRDGEEA